MIHLDLPQSVAYAPFTVPTISKALTQAYEAQDFTFSIVSRLREQFQVVLDAGAIVDLEFVQTVDAAMKAFERAQERVRIQRGRPLPTAQGIAIMRQLAREHRQRQRGRVFDLEPAAAAGDSASALIEDAQPGPAHKVA